MEQTIFLNKMNAEGQKSKKELIFASLFPVGIHVQIDGKEVKTSNISGILFMKDFRRLRKVRGKGEKENESISV